MGVWVLLCRFPNILTDPNTSDVRNNHAVLIRCFGPVSQRIQRLPTAFGRHLSVN